MSTAIYNGVNLGAYLLTERIEQAPSLDPSRSDQLYTDSILKVKSVIYPNCLASLPGEVPATTAARIRHLLTCPRKPLAYTTGGVTYFDLPGGLDDANGPMPLQDGFSVVQISEGAWIVTWGVRVCLTDCGSGSPPAYLSNRWEAAVSFDRDGYDTRRTSGLLIVSSRGPSSPDDLRSLVTPGIDPGFRRETADYRLAPDGLHYHYAFVDRKLSKIPPYPATTMDGEQVESCSVFGGKRQGMLNLTLTAPPTVDARDLLNACIKVAMGRVFASDPQRDQKANPLIREAAFRESLSDTKNAVSLSLKWAMRPAGSRDAGKKPGLAGQLIGGGIGSIGGPFGAWAGAAIGGQLDAQTPEGRDQKALPMFAAWLGRPLDGFDPARGIAPPLRGVTGQIRLVAAALRDPCGSDVELRSSGFDNQFVGTTSDGATVSVGTFDPSNPPDDTAALYSTEEPPGVWDTWVVTAHYQDDTGWDVLPPAKPGGAGKAVCMRGRAFTLRYEWAFTREGGEPTVPMPVENADENWVYVAGDFSSEPLDVAADGVSIRYSAAGYWIYKALDPAKVVISYPIPPFLNKSLFSTQPTVSELRGDPSIRGTGIAPNNPMDEARAILDALTGGGLNRLTAGGGLPGN